MTEPLEPDLVSSGRLHVGTGMDATDVNAIDGSGGGGGGGGVSHQFDAIFRKTCLLQSRQTKTNICFVLVIVFTMLLLGGYKLLLNAEVNVNGSSSEVLGGSVFVSNSFSTEPCKDSKGNFPCVWNYLFFSESADVGDSVGQEPCDGKKKHGLLGSIPQTYFHDAEVNNFYSPCFVEYPTQDAMDEELLTELEEGVTMFNFYEGYDLPTGAIYFEHINLTGYSFEYTVQTPSVDYFYNAYKNGDGSSLAQEYITTLNTMFLTNVTDKPTERIVSTHIEFLYTSYQVLAGGPLLDWMTLWFFPFALSVMMPSFMYILVLERSERLVEMMKMMGAKMSIYWLVVFLVQYLLYLCTVIVVIAMCFCLYIDTFTRSSPVVYLLLAFLWGLAQVSLGFVVSTLFSSPRAVAVFGYAFILVNIVVSNSINLWVFPSVPPPPDNPLVWAYRACMLYPPFAFVRGYYLLVEGTISPYGNPLGIESLYPGTQVFYCFLTLLLSCPVCIALAYYLDRVIPRRNSVSYSPFFPLFALFSWVAHVFKKVFRRCVSIKSRVRQERQSYEPLDDDISDDDSPSGGCCGGVLPSSSDQTAVPYPEDVDCMFERERVHDPRNIDSFLLRVVDLVKQYRPNLPWQTPHRALDHFCLGIKEGECFGLLGPNGAGKTTLVHILCGLCKPTSGDAYIAGYNVRKSMYKIHRILSFCPQDDILWEDMTCREHLEFYCRLKGVSADDVEAHVLRLLGEVSLTKVQHRKAKAITGGMRRRLSMAITLVGSPKVILLDEPTTGLDPAARRDLWRLINSVKAGRCIILTTHNMEEADALCNRIGIVSRGRLMCVGTPLSLKARFGEGYRLTVVTSDASEAQNASRNLIEGLWPSCSVESTFGTSRTYRLPRAGQNLGVFLAQFKERRESCGVVEWGINQTTLEEVFLNCVYRDEGENNDRGGGDVPSDSGGVRARSAGVSINDL
eukprot:TRINITY_DN2398_c0_g1_i1.p1 TRINITY_DN2398_c0_g1~~TRINITY_DN2398_c0_g1_i1.p1  ORF type:complete len:959 (-),score=230.66 TRINITY_DN2398_c0_g1_i1:64-2940(-)